MDFQNIIVGIILVAVLLYIGLTMRRKIRSFSLNEKSCGADCGCAEGKNRASSNF